MDYNTPDINYGNDIEIHVKANKQTRRSYLKFNLSAVPAGTTVTSAKLYLYCTAGPPSSLQVDVHETNDSWSEGTLTWNNAPVVGALVASNMQVNGTGQYYYWDITSYAQSQYGGDKILSVVVKFPLDDPYLDNPNYHRDFASKEYNRTSCDPYLEIAYIPMNTPPSISGLPDLELDEDTSLDNAIDLWNYASDAETPVGDLDFTILSVTEPDVGITIGSNRYIDVQPTANWYGTSEVTIQVSDGELTDTDSFNITVNPVNDPPILAPLPDQALDEDTTLPDAFDLDDYGSDIDGDPLTYSIIENTNPEVGVSIDPENRIDIAPEADWNGSSIVTIQVSDNLLTDSENFTITVNPVNDSPVAYDQSVTTDEDTPKSITLTAYDVDGDTLTYSVVTPPSHGILGGTAPNLIYTPDSDYFGPDSFTFKAYDGQAYSNIATVSITVNPENDPPTAPVVDVTPNSPVTTDDLTCTVTSPSADPDGDTITYTYKWYKDGDLQSSLTTVTTELSVTIDSSNTTEGEVWRCVVTPNDGVEDGPTDQDEVTIGAIPNSPPVLDPIGNKTVDEENLLSFTATASDVDLPEQTLIFSLGSGAPSGASITSGGDFTWTPTEAQGPNSYVVRIIVSDGIDQDFEDVTVTVNEVNLPPVLNPIGDKTVSEGTLLQFTITASDPDIPTQTLTYSASNLPSGATFNPSTRVFSWTPTSGQAGVYSGVHFEVSDGYLTDSEEITITVTSVAPPPVGGYALPITLDLGTSNSLIPRIGLASALSAAVAATIILVRRRKKTLKREH